MDEKDYADILDYVIEKLRKIEASHIIDQIEALEKVSIIENDKTEIKRTFKNPKNNQISFDCSDDNDSLKAIYKFDEKAYKDVSDSISRQMTYKEMFQATIEILNTYMVSTPIMVNRIKDLFDKESNSIKWAIEGSKKIDKEDKETSLLSIDMMKSEELAEIKNIIKILRDI